MASSIPTDAYFICLFFVFWLQEPISRLFHFPFFFYVFGYKSPFLDAQVHSVLIFLSVCSVTQILLEVTSKVNIHFRLLNWCNVWCCSRIQCLCHHKQHFPYTPFHYYTVPNSPFRKHYIQRNKSMFNVHDLVHIYKLGSRELLFFWSYLVYFIAFYYW